MKKTKNHHPSAQSDGGGGGGGTSSREGAGVDLAVVAPAGADGAAALRLGGVARQHVLADVGGVVVQVVVALLPLPLLLLLLRHPRRRR